MDLSDQKLMCRGINSILNDLKTDLQLRQVDLSYNIDMEEAFQPKRMAALADNMVHMLKTNKTLTALDLVGNHLGYFGPHPLNEQKRDFVLEIAKALPNSTCVRIDISDNMLTGKQGAKMTALGHYARHFIKGGGKYFLSRSNLLHSQALVMIASGMGYGSVIEYLDLNDNSVGLDPSGLRNSEGIQRFAMNAQHTQTLRVLKLARNALTDEDFELLGTSLAHVPTLQLLDVAGNHCSGVGCEAIKELVLSHGVLDKGRGLGLRELDISYNPLGALGVAHLAKCIPRTFTMEALSVAGCAIPTEDMYVLKDAMHKNGLIRRFQNHGNIADLISESVTLAEGQANYDIWRLHDDPMSVDPSKYPPYRYEALKDKLRFMDQKALFRMHKNPHFTVPLSTMKEMLYVLAPPSRSFQFSEVVDADSQYRARLDASKEMDRRVQASLKVYHRIMKWWHHVQEQRRIRNALLEKKRQVEEEERLQKQLEGLV